MEEIEVPIEGAQEEIHHHAEHERGTWISQVALGSAIMAVFAAIAASLGGHHSNEAVIDQIQAADQWSLYQAKGIKLAITETRNELKGLLGKPITEEGQSKKEKYEAEKEEISKEAKELESTSRWHLRTHQILARAVTLFQVAIAIAAISVLTRKRRYWYLSACFGVIGLGFFVFSFFVK